MFIFTNLKAKLKEILIFILLILTEIQSYFNYCQNVFLGGSMIAHGGQNPLEAARIGCNILHGPSISNFRKYTIF